MCILTHNIWKENDKPQFESGVLYIKVRTRAKYYYILIHAKNYRGSFKANNIAQYMLSNNCRNFWNEIKKVKNSNRKLPSAVENAIGSYNICNVFVTNTMTYIILCHIVKI